MTGATAAVLVGTIIALLGHRPHPGVVTTAGDRILTIATVVVDTMIHSTENARVLQTATGDTDMMRTGVGAPARTVAPAKGAIILTYLVATGTTYPTFRFS